MTSDGAFDHDPLESKADGDLSLPPRVMRVVAGALVRDEKCLIGRRKAGGSAGGMWEFPGGKMEPGESAAQALEREFLEELELVVRVGRALGTSYCETPRRVIALELLCVHDVDAPRIPISHAHDELLWAKSGDLAKLTWAPADVPLLDAVRRLLDTPPQYP